MNSSCLCFVLIVLSAACKPAGRFTLSPSPEKKFLQPLQPVSAADNDKDLLNGQSLAVTKDQPTDSGLSVTELERLADQIFENEASGDPEQLFFWSTKEDFPSLGIGHFIWFPKSANGAKSRFGGDSFPDLVRFLQQNGVALPQVLKDTLPELYCPWPTRGTFPRPGSAVAREMVDFLQETKALQMQHIVNRFLAAMEDFSASKSGPSMEKKIKQIKESPAGLYPLIDYVNFKGEGSSQSASSWGLWNVLDAMKEGSRDGHIRFAEAAVLVLSRRVQNHPQDAHFLEGWKNRIKTYETFRL